MTADPLAPLASSAAPAAIRAALLGEEAGDFDREYRQVMAEAIETLDLRPVLDMLERWRRVVMSSRDPRAHRRMLDTAERLRSGGTLLTEPWEQTRRRLGV